MRAENKKLEKAAHIDVLTIVIVVVLLLFGLVALLNVLSDPFDGTETSFEDFWNRLNTEFFARQVGNIIISIAVCVPITILNYDLYKPFIRTIYIISVGLLLLLLIAGESTRGVLGWYKIGTMAFQPSEICKVTLILSLSKFCADVVERKGKLSRFTDVMIAFLYFAILFVLVLLQGDLGTAIVYVMIFVAILFAAKISWIYIAGGAVACGVSLPLIYTFLLDNAQKARIRVFLDPTLDLQGDGLNVIRAKEIIGSGGFWGKGMFTQGTLSQSGYVPERHTDFIFSSIGEALGFFGAILLVALFFALLFRWLVVAKKAKDVYGRCLVVGCSAMLATHVFENIGMNLGIMPVTGIPLPLISYGGSNLLATMITVGIVLSVQYRSSSRRKL
ncbi:MAG: FtsW/RodA/SpoVE family cell cycle protein [Eubacteriales bacterium]|nr:FtsW/RodA/SpoVE family cell cycle protein [Eubacteriales bacterium]